MNLPAIETITVALGERSYPVSIGSGLLADHARWRDALRGKHVLVMSNTTVAPLYLDHVAKGLEGLSWSSLLLEDGEAHKSFANIGVALDALAKLGATRDACIIALGGGVIGDMAGFTAACWMRGIDFIQMPTTLLAMVDSSVGGKTGVNHPGGKNLIGAFYQPQSVIADIDTLATLPDRELRAGLAEIIKYGCIWDPVLFDWLENHIDKLTARDIPSLVHAIERSCQIKADVVGKDERESNLRAILNFGHTFGHAIESATNYETFLHGEAVALGMLMASDLSHRLGLLDAHSLKRLRDLLARAGLPAEAPRIGTATAANLMRMDKKVLAGTVRLVLLDGLGHAVVTGDYAERALDATLREFVA
jgi:3-dehydroquinate synthase